MKRTYDTMVDEWDEPIDIVPPYDAATEAFPQSPIFTDEYRKLRGLLASTVKLLEDPIRKSRYRDGVVESLLEEINSRTDSRNPEKLKIGLVGDMKSGKSSVINSLLSLGMVACQGDSGDSCTWVVQEFAYLFDGQEKPFAAKVHFFSEDERHEIIRGLFADYYRASPRDEDSKENGPEHWEQTVEDFGIRRTAITAFRSLFIDKEEFATLAAADKFLGSAPSEDDQMMLDILYEWSDDIMDKVQNSEGIFKAESTTTRGLISQLAPFMYSVEEYEGEPVVSCWPFVSHIRFGLEVPLLKHNLTLVDLPGLSDSNKMRVANATQHLRKCTHYMIVAKIDHANEDKFIQEYLPRACSSRGWGRTMLVLTHADTIDDETEVTGNVDDVKQLEVYKEEMKDLEKKKSEVSAQMKSAKGIGRIELMDTRDQCGADLREKRAQHREARIGMRTTSIVRKMRDLYTELTPDPYELPVFCVGNAAYKKHQAGYALDDTSPPTVPIMATYIPALRRALLLSLAEGQVNNTRHTATTQLPALFNCFDLYVSKTHIARKRKVEKFVVEPQKLAPDIIKRSFHDAIRTQVDDQVLDKIRKEEYSWTREAAELCQQWAKIYPATKHLAFLKRDGIQKGFRRKTATISWNKELVNLRAADLRAWFEDFLQSVAKAGQTITKELHRLLTNVFLKIKREPHVVLISVQPFLDCLYHEKGNVTRLVEQAVRSMRKEIQDVMLFATEDLGGNQIYLAMEPVYAKARTMKGNDTTTKERTQYFEQAVCKVGDGVWMAAHDLLRDQLEEIITKHAEELTLAVQEFLSDILKNFHRLCVDRTSYSTEEIELRDSLRKNLGLAREKLEREILPAAEACLGKLGGRNEWE